MFEFDAGKLIIIGIVALIVIGPKELPGVLRQVGHAVAKMRRMASEFQSQFMDAMREADMTDIKTDVAKLADAAKAEIGFNPVTELKTKLADAIDAAGKPAIGAPMTASEAIDASALAAPKAVDLSLNAIDLPNLAETAQEGGNSLLAAGVAPAPVAAEEAKAAPNPPPAAGASGVDAEMRALAAALEAEMRAPQLHAEAAKAQSGGG